MKLKKIVKFIFFRREWIYFRFPSETLKYLSFTEIFLSIIRSKRRDYGNEFKKEIQKIYPEAKGVYLYNAGRMALYTYLTSLNLRKGDKVLVPPFTCEVVINSIKYLDLVPIYCDISEETYNYDITSLKKVLSADRPVVVISQYSFGIPGDALEIVRLAKEVGAYVIEDCAHGFGIPVSNGRLGSFGDAAFFSTDQTKTFSTVLGGILICNRLEQKSVLDQLYEVETVEFPPEKKVNLYLQQLYFKMFNSERLFFITQFLQSFFYRSGIFLDLKDDGNTFKKPELYPMKMSGLQAYWGWIHLNRLEENFADRKKSVAFIEDILGIKKYTGIPLLRYPLLVENRDKQEWRFNSKYIEIGNWFDCIALGRTENYEALGYRQGQCAAAERIHRQIINLPLIPSNRTLYERVVADFLRNMLNIFRITHPEGKNV